MPPRDSRFTTARRCVRHSARSRATSPSPGSPRRGALFTELDPRRFAELHHNPTALLSELTDEDLARFLTPAYLEQLARVDGTAHPRPRRRDVVAEPRRAGRPPRRVLLGGVRPRREPARLLRRARRARGRPPQVRVGARRAARRDRPLLPPRLLPAAARRGRPAGRAVSRATTRAGCRSSSCRWRRSSSSRTTSGNLVPVRLGVWRARVGRISLYLLDTKVEGNPTWARDVTDTLYGGDRENRLRQELVLGVGGVRVLRRLGLEPIGVPHERGPLRLSPARAACASSSRSRASSADEALERLRASTVFTTHTPVPAGNEVFDAELVRRNLEAARRALRPRLGRLRRARQGGPERHAIRADAVRAAHVAVRERRLGAPRRRLARDVARPLARAAQSTRCRSRRSRTASTSGRGSRPSSRCCSATRIRSSSWRASCRPKTCGSRTAPRRQRLLRVRHRDARRARARPGRPHDRLRAPLRHLQAREPPLQRARRGSRSSSPTPSGRSRCSSPARRIRPTRAGRT